MKVLKNLKKSMEAAGCLSLLAMTVLYSSKSKTSISQKQYNRIFNRMFLTTFCAILLNKLMNKPKGHVDK